MTNTFKNIHGANILIPFGDWEPDSIWCCTEENIVYVVDGEDNIEDFGTFTREGYLQILEGWEQFQQENKWIGSIEKWLPNSLVDKLPEL